MANDDLRKGPQALENWWDLASTMIRKARTIELPLRMWFSIAIVLVGGRLLWVVDAQRFRPVERHNHFHVEYF